MSKKSQEKKVVMSRRQALQALGIGAVGFHPGITLLRSLVDGLITSAQAQTLGTKPRTLINYHLGGAPLRTYWDLPLSPYANSMPVRTPLTNTRIQNGQMVYSTTGFTVPGGTLYLPHLWNTPLPLASGGTVPMTNLLNNMLIMRGVQGNSLNQHPDGSREMTRPIGNAPSIMGMLADASTAPVQAVFMGNQYNLPRNAFAAKNSAQVQVRNFNDPLNEILRPFNRGSDPTGSTFMSRRSAMDNLIQQGLAMLGQHSSARVPGSEALYTMRNSAETIMRNGVSEALSLYPAIYSKYQRLISTCANNRQVGITDSPIALPGATSKGINATIVNAYNNPSYIQNSDVRTVIQSSTMPGNMAENFAVAEVLATLGLSQSIMIGSGSMNNMNYQGAARFGDRSSISVSNVWDFDEHDGGPLTSLIINSFLFHALATCMNELFNQLKAKNLWNESVFFVTSDFGRNMRMDDGSGYQSGSDHDEDACNFSVFSGAITAPVVIGNCGIGESRGDWGKRRPVNGVFGTNRAITVADAVSTVAGLARCASPTDNNPSLVSASGIPLIERARETA